MTPSETVISFYNAFKERDGDRMASLYSEEVEFGDPVFPSLKGEEAKSMWRMLCGKAKDLRVDYKVISSEGNTVCVKWNTYYTFSSTGRQVHNDVVSNLLVENGKIRKHFDKFNFWKWASQAVGPVGILLGWLPFLKKKIQAQAASSLKKFKAKNS